MSVYYNEHDPFAAAWLRELMTEGLIPDGEIDTRSVVDVAGSDLRGFAQCHFFAGIGGWSYALRLAGWSDDSPVWTGSCPCQPFSAAGKQRGAGDERHLWPEFGKLISECNPPVVFGEQVASRLGREWLAGVRADLEALGYAVGAADLCAAGVGAPHIRQRLYWMADAQHAERRPECEIDSDAHGRHGLGRRCDTRRLGESDSSGSQPGQPTGAAVGHRRSTDAASGTGGLGDADDARSQGRRIDAGEHADQRSPWAASVLIPCADGKARRVEPGIFPLAHGVSNRVGTLRGAGNAIVPQIAAAFIRACLDNS